MRPRTGKRNVKVVPPGLRLKPAHTTWSGIAVVSDPASKGRFSTNEGSARAFGVVPLIDPDAVDEQTHGRASVTDASLRGSASRLLRNVLGFLKALDYRRVVGRN